MTSVVTTFPKRTKNIDGPDEHYGAVEELGCAIIDMLDDEYLKEKNKFLNSLKLTMNEIVELERRTIGQQNNSDWQTYRKSRLTASNFGKVCKLRPSTSRANAVKSILYDIFQGNSATRVDFTGKSAGLLHEIVIEDSTNFLKPIDVFFSIIDNDILLLMCNETNRYVHQRLNSGPVRRSSRMSRWKDVDIDEMKKFLGVLMFSGVVVFPTYESYWKKDSLYYHELFHKIGMSLIDKMEKCKEKDVMGAIQVFVKMDRVLSTTNSTMSSDNLKSPVVSDQQMLLRSAKSSAPPSPSPLSSEEFNRVISAMRKTQDATFAQCKALSLSFNKKFCELQASVDSLASQIVDIRADNTSLRNELSTLNNRIGVIESDVGKLPSSSGDNIPQLLQELSEREKCSFNAIVHGLIESSATIPTERLSDDLQHLSESILPLAISLPPDVKMIRLGRTIGKNPRPLKVIFSSKIASQQFTKDFVTGMRSRAATDPPLLVSVVRDRTLMERQQVRQVYADLEQRRRNGENNIVVRHFNGVPSIVQANKDFQLNHTTHRHVTLAKN
ncbi:hypothetical protein ACI65C_013246 [Semiaphis heraclei]